MLKITKNIILCALLSCFISFSLPAQAEEATQELIEAINHERIIRNLKPLEKNAHLEQAAFAKATAIMELQIFTHNLPGRPFYIFADEAGYEYKVLGENLAIDYQNPTSAIHDWMRSPTHRKNILDPRFTETGVAIIPLPESNSFLAVQLFGKPKISLLPLIELNIASKQFNVQVNSIQAIIGSSLLGSAMIIGFVAHHYSSRKSEIKPM